MKIKIEDVGNLSNKTQKELEHIEHVALILRGSKTDIGIDNFAHNSANEEFQLLNKLIEVFSIIKQ